MVGLGHVWAGERREVTPFSKWFHVTAAPSENSSIPESPLEILIAQQNRSFGLVNRDFRAHTLLVNGESEIISMIELDGVMAPPIDVIAQFPQLTGLDREILGYVEIRPAAIERIKRITLRLMACKDMVALAFTESELWG